MVVLLMHPFSLAIPVIGNMCVTENCVICLNPAKFKRLNGASKALAVQKMKNKDGIQNMGERLKCGHIYHRKCIMSWFLNLDSENSYNCPLCRGEIQFSNNMGMMNWMLFDRKYRLEYAKAYAEGYREDDEDYEDEEDGEDYDEDEDSGSESSWENYDDFVEGIEQPVRDLRYYLSHEGDEDDADDASFAHDFTAERDRFDQSNASSRTSRNEHYDILTMSYRCIAKLERDAICYLTLPKSSIYAFRPHQSSFVH